MSAIARPLISYLSPLPEERAPYQPILTIAAYLADFQDARHSWTLLGNWFSEKMWTELYYLPQIFAHKNHTKDVHLLFVAESIRRFQNAPNKISGPMVYSSIAWSYQYELSKAQDFWASQREKLKSYIPIQEMFQAVFLGLVTGGHTEKIEELLLPNDLRKIAAQLIHHSLPLAAASGNVSTFNLVNKSYTMDAQNLLILDAAAYAAAKEGHAHLVWQILSQWQTFAIKGDSCKGVSSAHQWALTGAIEKEFFTLAKNILIDACDCLVDAYVLRQIILVAVNRNDICFLQKLDTFTSSHQICWHNLLLIEGTISNALSYHFDECVLWLLYFSHKYFIDITSEIPTITYIALKQNNRNILTALINYHGCFEPWLKMGAIDFLASGLDVCNTYMFFVEEFKRIRDVTF